MNLRPISEEAKHGPILAHYPLYQDPSLQFAVVQWNEELGRFYLVHGGSYLGIPESFIPL